MHVNACVFVHTRVWSFVCVRVCTCVYLCECVLVCTCDHTHVCCMRASVFASVSVCAYVHCDCIYTLNYRL